MAVVNLPDGGHVVVHDKLTVAGRRVLAPAFTDMVQAMARQFPKLRDFATLDLTETEMATLMLGGADGEFMAKSLDFQSAAIVAFVKEWSYGPPPTLDTVLHFTEDPDVFDELAAQVAPLALAAMKPKQWGPSGHGDPSSPTVPSSGSEPGGRAQTTPSTHLTETPSNGSESTTTGASFI